MIIMITPFNQKKIFSLYIFFSEIFLIMISFTSSIIIFTILSRCPPFCWVTGQAMTALRWREREMTNSENIKVWSSLTGGCGGERLHSTN